MGRLTRTVIILSLTIVLVSAGSAFHKHINQQGAALNKAFHDSLLSQLANSRNASLAAIDATGITENATSSVPRPSSFAVADDTLQIYLNSTLPADPALPPTCAQALIANVSCNSTISLMSISPLILGDQSDLQIVCSPKCATSLALYRAAVVSACAGYTIHSNNVTYSATFAVDSILGPYTTQCLQDPNTLQFCNLLLSSYNVTGGLLALPSSKLCTYCTLKTLNTTLSNPATYSVPIADLLSSAISICGPNYALYNISSPPPAQVTTDPGSQFGMNATMAPADDCAITGRNITVSSNTTCAQVATLYNVSDNNILVSNPFLDVNCNIGAGMHLCVPQPCQTYTIRTNDTCESVSAFTGSQTGVNITTVQLQSFNPELGTYCQLMPLRVGQKICLTPNGGFPNVVATSVGNPSATPTAQAPVPTPTANGTTSNCGRYYQVQQGDVCNAVVLNNSVSLPDFLTMNPEIDSNCTNLWLSYYYCVAPYPPLSSISSIPTITSNYSTATTFSYAIPTSYTPVFATVTLTEAGVPAPTNVANGTRTIACGFYYNVMQNDTLSSIANTVGVDTTDLISWNPELQNGPPPVNSAICVIFPRGNYTLHAAPTPINIAPNTTTNCAQFYTVQSGDRCDTIETKFGLTSSQFLALNGGLEAQCTNLILGVAYCVFPTTPLSNDTSSTPGNVAPGTITAGCTKYYTIVSGDSCPAVETKFGLTFSQFVAMNPEIDSQCSNLALGEAYCVQSTSGGGGSTGPPGNLSPGSLNNCTTYHTVISGDNCPVIEIAFHIAASDFFRWNPEVNTACSNIIAGDAYCVGGGGSACMKTYTVKSGDFCSAITQSQGITPAQLNALNPQLNANCDLSVGENHNPFEDEYALLNRFRDLLTPEYEKGTGTTRCITTSSSRRIRA